MSTASLPSPAIGVFERLGIRSRTGAVLAATGAVYVAAWVLGLLIGPSAPSVDASARAIHRYYLNHPRAIVAQSLLVHGIAGVALLVLAVGFRRIYHRTGTLADVIAASGLVAGLISLVQVGLAIAATYHVKGGPAGTSRNLFHAINTADLVKLVFLAAFVVAVTLAASRTATAPSWLQSLGAVLTPLLVVGGIANVVDSGVLSALLAISLVLLLVWVAAVTFTTARRLPFRGNLSPAGA